MHELVKGRALHLKLVLNSQVVNLLNVYAPSKEETRRPFFDSVFSFFENFPLSEDLWLFGGDFNCTLDPILDRSAGKEHHPGSAAILRKIIDFTNLVDIHRSFLGRDKCFTWSNTVGSGSRLDRFYISPHFQPMVIKTSLVNCHLSDHEAVLLTMNLGEQVRNRPFWKLDINLLEDPDYVQAITCFWKN